MKKIQSKQYVMVVAYVPGMSQEAVEKMQNNFQNLNICEIDKSFYLGKKSLAYPIRKYIEAHYVKYYFSISEDFKNRVEKIKTFFNPERNNNVVRSIVLSMPDYHKMDLEFNNKALEKYQVSRELKL